jgi:hypothetical protein
MDHDQYIMLARRNRELTERNETIKKMQLELTQEFNRNNQEIEDIYVKMKRAENAMAAWKGIVHG